MSLLWIIALATFDCKLGEKSGVFDTVLAFIYINSSTTELNTVGVCLKDCNALRSIAPAVQQEYLNSKGHFKNNKNQTLPVHKHQ